MMKYLSRQIVRTEHSVGQSSFHGQSHYNEEERRKIWNYISVKNSLLYTYFLHFARIKFASSGALLLKKMSLYVSYSDLLLIRQLFYNDYYLAGFYFHPEKDPSV